MSLIISTRHEGEIAIAHVQGALTLGPALSGLKSRVQKVLSEQTSKGLILNLAGVAEIDSAGLGELVAIHSLAARHGLNIAIVQATPRLKELLAVTHVDGFFTFYENERSAVASFG